MKEHNIVGVHGVPRSGTSWLGQLVNASPDVNFKFQPLFSYAFKDFIDESSTESKVAQFFEELSISEDDFINLKDKELLGDYPSFAKNEMKTHLVFKHVRYHFLIEHLINSSPNIKFLLMIRNPLEVLNSWRKVPREFKANWDFEKEWYYANLKNTGRKHEYFGYKKWKEASELFITLNKKYPDNVLIVNYDDLVSNTLAEVKVIYDYIGLKIDNQVIDFIQKSKSKEKKHPNSVFKSNNNSKYLCKQEISEDIQGFIFNDLKGSELFKILGNGFEELKINMRLRRSSNIQSR